VKAPDGGKDRQGFVGMLNNGGDFGQRKMLLTKKKSIFVPDKYEINFLSVIVDYLIILLLNVKRIQI